jgi:hypothetical protein
MPKDLFAEQNQPKDLFAESGITIEPQEKPVLNRFLSGVGGSLLNQSGNAAELISPRVGEKLQEYGQEGLDTAQGSAGQYGKTLGAVLPYFATGGGGLAAQSAKTALLSGLTTEGTPEERLSEAGQAGATNVVLGGALKGAGGVLSKWLKGSAEKAAIKNAEADIAGSIAALNEGRKAGFVVNPADVNPTWYNNILASIGGKAAMNQAQQARNVKPATVLAKETLDLPKTAQLNQETFDAVVAKNMKPYEDLASLPEPTPLAKGYSGPKKVYNAKDDLRDLKALRDEVRQLSKTQEINYSSQNAEQLKSAFNKIDDINSRFKVRAEAAGKKEYIPQFEEARVNLAKLATVEKAVNKVTGKIDARAFGKLIDKNAPLTGPIAIAGRFEQAFPMSIREAEKIPSEFVNQLARGVLPFAVGGSAAYAGQDPTTIIASTLATMAAPGAARKLLLSKAYQKAFANIPKAKPSSTLSIIDAILQNEATKRSIPAISRELTQ